MLPPRLRIPAAGSSAGVAGRDAHTRARRQLLARARRPMAVRSQDHRQQHPRLGLLPDILDTEHRPLPRAAAHR